MPEGVPVPTPQSVFPAEDRWGSGVVVFDLRFVAFFLQEV